MKKLLQMKFMLLLCALIVGSGTMWAADPITLWSEDFSSYSANDVPSGGTYNYSCGGTNTMVYDAALAGGESPELLLQKSSNGTFTATIPLDNIEGDLTLTFKTNNQKIKVETTTNGLTGGLEEKASGTHTATFKGVTTSTTSITIKFTCSGSSNVRLDDIVLTGTKSSGGGDTPTTWTVTYDGNGATSGTVPTDATAYESGATVTVLGNTGDLAKTGCAFDGWNTQANGGGTNYDADDTFTISANTTLYAKWTPYTITAQSNNESYGTVTLSGNEITGSPNSGYRYADPAYTVAPENSATVVQDGNTFTVTPTANTTITINFEAIPTHTATFSVNGTTTTTDFQEGAAITFPANPADIEGKSFVGWTGTAISGTTDETPTFVTSATMGDADIFLYAVFAKVEQGGEDTYEVLSSNIFDVNANYVIAAKQSANDATMWYFYSYGNKVDENASWGKMTTDPSTNAPITFTLSGTASELIVQANTGHYLKGLTTGNFQMSASSQKVALDGNGNIKNGNYALRHNYNNGNGGLRWYNSSTGQPANFYKVIPGITYSGYCTTVAADTREEAGLGFVESTAIVEWYNAAQYTGQALTNPHSVSPITWTSSNEGVATVENDGTVTVLALGETTIKASFDGDNDYKKGEASYTLTVQDTREEPTVTIHDTFITHTNVFEGTAAGKLTASVKYNDNTIEGATVTWSGDNDAVATINATSGSVDLVAAGTVTFTAAYAGNEDYKAKTATYEMTVTYSDPNAPGTVNNPYTVAEARAAIDAGTGVTEVYARGIVSEIVTPFNSQFGNITYNISEDGSTTSDQLQAYRGKGIGGANFTSADDIQVGDVVVVYGDLKKYEDTYEFAQNNQLVSLKLVAPTFYPEAGGVASGTELTISDLHTYATIYYTTDGTTPTASSTLYDSENKPVITAATTIKAIAVKAGYTSSDVVTASYTILSPAATPTFSPEGGIYTSAQSVTISSDTEDATIYYTLDGSDPTTSSIKYTEAIVVDETVTIKAIAVKEGMANSAVATATYTMNIPSIDAEDVDLTYNTTAGSIDFTITNPAEGTLTAAIIEGNWLTLGTISDNAVAFTCSANEGSEDRTAIVKLTYTYDTNKTVDKEVTITQAYFDFAQLPFTFNGGRADIEETDGLTQEGLGTDYNANNNPTTKLKFDSTGDWMILTINEIPGTLTFDIKGNGFSGGTFKVQTSADGTTYTDLATYTDLGDTQTETFNNLAAEVRYIKWIYTNKSNGNVGLGNISLGNTMAVAIAAACTDGTKCYSTFSSSKPFVVPEGLTVSEIEIQSDGTMNVEDNTYTTGETVPANTGVMVSATDGGNYVVNISKEAGTSKLGTNNALRPSGDNGITADEMAGETGCKFYRLTMHNGEKIGFWWGATGGDSFAIVANKAYLAVPASVAGARNGFAFGDDATGINNVNVNENVNGSVFDLQGRKVSKPGKGLYIVNGRKVVIK